MKLKPVLQYLNQNPELTNIELLNKSVITISDTCTNQFHLVHLINREDQYSVHPLERSKVSEVQQTCFVCKILSTLLFQY